MGCIRYRLLDLFQVFSGVYLRTLLRIGKFANDYTLIDVLSHIFSVVMDQSHQVRQVNGSVCGCDA